jgi:signal peptidase I
MEMTKERESSFTFFRELPLLLVTAVIIAWVVKSFIIHPFWIPTGSMEPTLMPQDRVLVNKFIYKFTQPKRGDIVVFIPPGDSGKDYIKRVIGLPGETIEVKGGNVFINGKLLEEPYRISAPDRSNYGPLKIPKDHIFVMGDNRPNSADSRYFGPLPINRVIGKAFLIYWPPWRIRLIR